MQTAYDTVKADVVAKENVLADKKEITEAKQKHMLMHRQVSIN